MGCTPKDAPASPAGAGNRNPKTWEAIQSVGGLWWLAVNGDPARIVLGSFGSEDSANAHRQWLIDHMERTAPSRGRAAGDELARRIADIALWASNMVGMKADIARHDAIQLRDQLCNAVNAYRQAVDHG